MIQSILDCQTELRPTLTGTSMLRRRILQVLIFLEDKRGGVEAEAQSSRLGAIFKNVTQMRAATDAFDFDPVHPVTVVGFGQDVFLGDRLEEAGPAGAGIELRLGREQRQIATNAVVDAGFMIVKERAAKGGLGALTARDAKLLGRQLFGPFGVRLDYFGSRNQRAGKAVIIEKANLYHSDLIGSGVLYRWWRVLGLRVAACHAGGQSRNNHQFEHRHHGWTIRQTPELGKWQNGVPSDASITPSPLAAILFFMVGHFTDRRSIHHDCVPRATTRLMAGILPGCDMLFVLFPVVSLRSTTG
jgi:hypothetical protein